MTSLPVSTETYHQNEPKLCDHLPTFLSPPDVATSTDDVFSGFIGHSPSTRTSRQITIDLNQIII